MKRVVALLLIMSFVLLGCSSNDLEQTQFMKKEDNYYIKDKDNLPSYTKLIESLKTSKVDLKPDTKVAAVTTSTANLLFELGLNVVGASESPLLNQELKEKQKNGEIINFGSALKPNLESILLSGAEIIFVSDKIHQIPGLESLNVVKVPQSIYSDIFTTVEVLGEKFQIDYHNIFNKMVETDKKAKDLIKNHKGTYAPFRYTLGEFSAENKDSLLGSMLQELKLVNIYANNPDVNLSTSLEQLLLDNPDNLVVYTHGTSNDEFYKNIQNTKEFQQLSAFINKKVILLDKFSGSAYLTSPDELLKIAEGIVNK